LESAVEVVGVIVVEAIATDRQKRPVLRGTRR
jgi:hypothetical protein